MNKLQLNQRAAALCAEIDRRAAHLHVVRQQLDCGTTLFDFGVEAAGGLDAGLMLARVCLADLADVVVLPEEVGPGQRLRVATRQPVAACMASQYAGWEIKGENFFAMGSGPMRAAAGREPLFEEIGYREQPTDVVGVLESSQFPPEEVCRDIAAKCGVGADHLTLLIAPTNSLAGTLQVVARSVETALHKLHELGFDLSRVESGRGTAPIPPVASDALAAIGLTNDAILYGGEVTLEVHGDDATLQKIGPQTPSSASADYGRPFGEVLAAYDNDFYRVDPLLFSAAVVRFVNLDTGNAFEFGEVNREVLGESFGGAKG